MQQGKKGDIMHISRYDELSHMQRDILKEIGSIGTGNAATALSSLLSKTVKMTVPDVSVLGYNDAVKTIGNPEEIIAGVMVHMSGEIDGIMLYMQKLDFVNLVLQQTTSKTVDNYFDLSELDVSALVEVGNIIISTYASALSRLTDVSIDLSVPGIAISMLGGIITVPMAELGYETDKVMIIDGKFICDGTELSSNLLMMPDMRSLNYLLDKMGRNYG